MRGCFALFRSFFGRIARNPAFSQQVTNMSIPEQILGLARSQFGHAEVFEETGESLSVSLCPISGLALSQPPGPGSLYTNPAKKTK